MEDDPPRLDRSGAKRFVGLSVGGLAALIVGAVTLGLLVALVQTRSPALLAVDKQVAAWLNDAVAGHSLLVRVLQLITALGDWVASAVILSTLTVVLLVRRLPRLASYVALTGLGAGVLSPAVKQLVGRLRPVVETPVGTAAGPGFPSGHALGSMVTYGVLLLVLLPAVPRRARPPVVATIVTLVVAIGFTRLALGVHYLSDVVAGWLIGLGWLVVTTAAFRTWRRGAGLPSPVAAPGLAPEAARALEPAPQAREPTLVHPRRRAAQLLVVWVLLLGTLLSAGWLITGGLTGTGLLAFDSAVVQWLAEHRTPALTTLSVIGTWVGGTVVVSTVTLASLALALAVTRQWRPPLFLAVTMAGEVTLFLATTRIVGRPRPPVPPLDPPPPVTSSFPSGHLAAAICLYAALCLLVFARTTARWRWLVLGAAAALVVLVAFTRLYRGLHYPTDLMGSVLLALPWLLATCWVLRPGRRPTKESMSPSW